MRLLLGVFIFILVASIVTAVPPVTQVSQAGGLDIAYPPYQYTQVGKNFTLNIHVYNTSNYIKGAMANCYLDLYDSMGTEVFSKILTVGTTDYSIYISQGNFTKLGTYSYIIQCNTTSQSGFANGIFMVTYLGEELDAGRAILYVGLFALLIFLFVINIYAIPQLPNDNNRDESGVLISINQLKYLRPVLYVTAYLLLMSIVYIGSNISYAYLGTVLLGKLLFNIFRIMMLMMYPMVLVWFIYLLHSAVTDRELKNKIERGWE